MNTSAHGLRANPAAAVWLALIAIATVAMVAPAASATQESAPADVTSSLDAEQAPVDTAGATQPDQADGDAQTVGSAQAPTQTPIPPLRDEDTRKAFWQMLASLLVVLVLVVVAAIVGKKFLPRLTAKGRRQLRLMETLHIAPRSTVHLMRVGDRVFMLGSTKESMTALGDVTEAVAIAPGAEEGGDA